MADNSEYCLKNILMICIFVLFFFPAFASATTYYVSTSGNDGNSGTSTSSAWRTIQKAANTVNPGDTVRVLSGTYNQRVEITRSGSSGNYITFMSDTDKGATINGGASSPATLGSGLVSQYKGVFDIYASYIKISGFRIINSGYVGVGINNYGNVGPYSNIIIEKNYFNNMYSSAILAARAGPGIIFDNNEVTNSHIANAGSENEVIDMMAVNGFEIKNNYVHDNANTESITIKPLWLSGGTKLNTGSGTVHHNNIKPIGSAGIYVDGGTNIDVYDNVVHDGSGTSRGIALAVEGGVELKNNRVYNNIVYNNGAYGIVIALYSSCDSASYCSDAPVDNIQIVGNTVYRNDYSMGWGGGIANDNPSATNIVIRNNIVSQNNKNQIRVVGSGNTVQNNLIDGYAGAANEINSGSNGNIAGNPAFVNPSGGNFHISSSSPAIDKGYGAGSPYNVDYDGKSRPAGAAYDIGAYEYGGSSGSCVPNWKCESPLNGYEFDGCGNRRLNAACNAQATNNPPSISVTHSPASLTPTTTVTITASATDDKALSQVMVYVDALLKKTCNTAGASNSCSYASAFPAGTHSYYAIAKDNAGKTATASTKQFTVSSSSTPPPASTSGKLLINTNPTGATVTVSGQNLGTTPYYINPRAYPSPTFVRLTKSNYVSVNAAMYQWMVPPVYTSITYNMRPL